MPRRDSHPQRDENTADKLFRLSRASGHRRYRIGELDVLSFGILVRRVVSGDRTITTLPVVRYFHRNPRQNGWAGLFRFGTRRLVFIRERRAEAIATHGWVGRMRRTDAIGTFAIFRTIDEKRTRAVHTQSVPRMGLQPSIVIVYERIFLSRGITTYSAGLFVRFHYRSIRETFCRTEIRRAARFGTSTAVVDFRKRSFV